MSTIRDAFTESIMPTAAHQECRHPHCPGYAVRNGFCAIHSRSTKEPKGRGLRPSNSRFRRLRHSFLVRHPMCNACKVEPATVLDHIIPHRNIATLFWAQNNWQGLCVHCHGVKSALELFSEFRNGE